MKRIIAATVITAAAVATLAGCSVSTSQPLALNTDDCSKFESALGTTIDGLKLESHSKLDDKGGQCVWSGKKDAVVAIDIDNKDNKSGVQVNTESQADKIAKDKTLTVIDNETVTKLPGSVLYTAKGTEKSENREFTVTTDLDSTVKLITSDLALSNDEASKIFTGLFAG